VSASADGSPPCKVARDNSVGERDDVGVGRACVHDQLADRTQARPHRVVPLIRREAVEDDDAHGGRSLTAAAA